MHSWQRHFEREIDIIQKQVATKIDIDAFNILLRMKLLSVRRSNDHCNHSSASSQVPMQGPDDTSKASGAPDAEFLIRKLSTRASNSALRQVDQYPSLTSNNSLLL
jgi:hypothetical protein